MARTTDRERILDLLAQAGQGLSNGRIRSQLNMKDERYQAVRGELLSEELVEKYVCRGGGLRLTRKGDKEASPEEETKSAVSSEKELYAPLVAALESDAHDGVEEVIFDTSSLRKRGQWQNPDVTQVTIQVFPRLRVRDVAITTYEAKPWGMFDVTAVFEAASHARYAHEGFVVFEWPEATFDLEDARIARIVQECQRFGVGLATMKTYYSKYRFETRLEPISRTPSPSDVEEWLDYALERRQQAAKAFEEAMARSDRLIRGGRE